MLCLVSPAVQDIIVDVTGWVLGEAECCADDCDEGTPCTQQCVHCVCGTRLVAAPHELTAPLAGTWSSMARTEQSIEVQLGGHLEPPFRPPVS